MQKNLPIFSYTISEIEQIENSIKIFLGPCEKRALTSNKLGELQWVATSATLLNTLIFPNSSQKLMHKLFFHSLGKPAKVSGNGSTIAVLLACQLLKSTLKFTTSGYSPLLIANGLIKSNYFLAKKVFDLSFPISSKNQIKGLFQTAFKKKMRPELCEFLYRSTTSLCREGLLAIEENASSEDTFEIISGIEIEQGFSSFHFSNTINPSEIIYENPFLLIASSPIDSINQLQQIIEFLKIDNRSLIIIAETISNSAVSALFLQNIKKKAKISIIKYSAIKFLKLGILEDLSLLAHSSFYPFEIDKARNWSITDLGQISRAIIKKNRSLFIFSKFSKILMSRRINELNRELLLCPTDYEKNLLKARICRLGGNLTRIKVGKISPNEIDNERNLLECAISTLESSLEEGLLPGGGIIYLQLKEELFHWSVFNLVGDELASACIINNALIKIVISLFVNYNIPNVLLLIKKIQHLGFPWGYQLVDKKFINTLSSNFMGLFDPAKSVRIALWTSISLVSNILTSE